MQHGEEVEVVSNGHTLRGPAVIRGVRADRLASSCPRASPSAPANLITAATVELRGTRELVGAPAAVGASGAQAEQVADETPTEQERADAGGVGGDGTLPAEDAGDL